MLILFAVGIIAGFINVTSGGGSTLSVPVLIFLGLDAALANGTNRVAIVIQNIAAVYAFKREKYQQFKLSLKLSLLTLPASIAGALLAVEISNVLFQKILGFVMIGIVLSMIVPRAKMVLDNTDNKEITWSVALSMLLIGFYGGFIQVGVGFLLMAAMNYLLKFDLVHVNMHKVFIILIYTLPALVIFIISKDVDWAFGLCLAGGNALGGWWAAKASVKKGDRLIKAALIVALLIMSLKLLEVF